MKRLSSLLLLTTLSFSIFAQANLKQLDKYLEEARVDWGVVGMSVAIVKDDEIVLNKGFGAKEEGKDQKVDEHTLYAIASNTKAFISSSLAILVEEGHLDWDDPVRQYLPYFELYDPYVSDEISIRDLLCHRSGLGTFSGDVIWYKSNYTAEEVVQKVKYVPQAYSFRSGYGYSNLMFITAGEVIRAVTGMAWHEYAREQFFNPLGMDRTITSTDDLPSQGNFATPHKPVDDKNQPIPWVNWDNMGAARGIISSTTDMAQWIKMNLNGGIFNGDTILPANQQNLLWTPHNNYVMSQAAKEFIPGRHFNGYGLGWGTFDYYGRQVVTHSGGYDGMYSRVVLVPDEKLGFVILTNSMTGISNPLMLQIINAYIQEDNRDWSQAYLNRQGSGGMKEMKKKRMDARVPETNATVDIEYYEGTYEDPMYGKIQIRHEDDQLRLIFDAAPDLSASLNHWHYDTWEIKWDNVHAWFDFGTVQFVIDNNQQITGIEFDVPNYDIFFDEIHAKRVR
jgi:CubicO group peptidase (beta-lactamase class C family)